MSEPEFLTALLNGGEVPWTPRGRVRQMVCAALEWRTFVTPREAEVLALLVSMSTKEAASKLGVTPKMVAFHRRKALHALGRQSFWSVETLRPVRMRNGWRRFFALKWAKP